VFAVACLVADLVCVSECSWNPLLVWEAADTSTNSCCSSATVIGYDCGACFIACECCPSYTAENCKKICQIFYHSCSIFRHENAKFAI